MDFGLPWYETLLGFIPILGAGALLGAAGTYAAVRRLVRPKVDSTGELERRVALLEQELSASRALVEELTEERRFPGSSDPGAQQSK